MFLSPQYPEIRKNFKLQCFQDTEISSEQIRKEGLSWALETASFLRRGQVLSEDIKETVRIDESWSYIYKEGRQYYRYEGKKELHRNVLQKGNITKVMFLLQ